MIKMVIINHNYQGNILREAVKMEDTVVTTPEYNIVESDINVKLHISAPLCRTDDVSVFLHGKSVEFKSHPYFLKVRLPCQVNTEIIKEFDEIEKIYTITFKKNCQNNGSDSDNGDNEENGVIQTIHECNKHEDKISDSTQLNTGNTRPHYGFLNKYHDMFGQCDEFSRIIDLPDPDTTKQENRTQLRKKEEKEKWNEDHYLADLMEPEELEPCFNYKPPWLDGSNGTLNSDEINILDSIPKGDWYETNLTSEEETSAKMLMIDVLLAYCYNKRTTEGENTVESGWTINKLSSSLSWLEVFTDLKQVLLSFYKRSITYPLYRNWQLTKMVHRDVVDLLKSGSSHVIRSFIEIKGLFHDSDNRYILNTLYINDLCHFSSHLTQDKFIELASCVEEIEIKKHEIEDIVILEMAARMALGEEMIINDECRAKYGKFIANTPGCPTIDHLSNTASSDSESDLWSSSDSSTSVVFDSSSTSSH